MDTFITVLVIAVVLFLIYWYLISLPQRRRSKKLSEALRKAGLEISFIYQGNHDPFEEKDFPRQQLPLLWTGDRSKFSNVMQGLSSLGKTYLFEFSYETGNGDSLSTYTQTVTAFFLPGVSLPAFSIRPAKILQKIVPLTILQSANNALWNNEMIFDSHPTFSRAYQLKGPDEAALHSLFRPALLEYCEALPTNERWSTDGSGQWLIVFRDNVLIPPEALSTFLRQTVEIASLFQRNAPLSRI